MLCIVRCASYCTSDMCVLEYHKVHSIWAFLQVELCSHLPLGALAALAVLVVLAAPPAVKPAVDRPSLLFQACRTLLFPYAGTTAFEERDQREEWQLAGPLLMVSSLCLGGSSRNWAHCHCILSVRRFRGCWRRKKSDGKT